MTRWRSSHWHCLWLRSVSVASPYGYICSQLLDPEDEGIVVLHKVWNYDLEDMPWDPRSFESFVNTGVNNLKYCMIFFHLLHPMSKSSKRCSTQSEDKEAAADAINSAYITLKNLVCVKWEIVLRETPLERSFPNCAPLIPRDSSPVPRGSVGAFLWWLHWSWLFFLIEGIKFC